MAPGRATVYLTAKLKAEPTLTLTWACDVPTTVHWVNTRTGWRGATSVTFTLTSLPQTKECTPIVNGVRCGTTAELRLNTGTGQDPLVDHHPAAPHSGPRSLSGVLGRVAQPACSGVQGAEAVGGFGDDVFLFGEGEADEVAPESWSSTKALTGRRRHRPSREFATELCGVVESEGRGRRR